MVKDFSQEAEEQMLALIDQIEGEQINCVTDWFGDRWYDFRDLIGTIKIDNYLNHINDYYKIILDKNNVSKEQIRTMFTNVRNIDSRYMVRFAACKSRLEQYNTLVTTTANMISPEKGLSSADEIKSVFMKEWQTFSESEEILKNLSGDGLKSEDLEDLDEEQLGEILDKVGKVLVTYIPNVKVGEKMEIPIGPDLTFYYETKFEVKNDSNIDLNVIVEEQKIKIKNWSASAGEGKMFSVEGNTDGEFNASITANDASVKIGIDGSCEYNVTIHVDDDEYSVKVAKTLETLVLEESVKTETDDASVKTTVGMKKRTNQWKNLPVLEPVEEPYTISIPKINPDWGYVVVVGGVIVFAAGVVMAPYTGGSSLVLCTI